MTSRPIWEYPTQTVAASLLRDVLARRMCPCCVTHDLLAPNDETREHDARRYTEERKALTCRSCGWWCAYREAYDSSCGTKPDWVIHVVTATGAALQTYGEFPDRQTLMVLQSEIEQHMMGIGASSAWAAMEDATAAILRSFGFDVRVTARTKDGGVDIILDRLSDGPIFVQVKHSRNKVDVRVFRELVGTMVLGGVHKRLLVTSPTFTEGAHALKDTADLRGLPVELVDGERFLSALKLSTRLQAPTLAEVLAVAAPLITLTQEEIQI